jgi:hypothetical protein
MIHIALSAGGAAASPAVALAKYCVRSRYLSWKLAITDLMRI